MLETSNRITITIHEIRDYRWFTHQIKNGNQWKILYYPCLLKTPQNTTNGFEALGMRYTMKGQEQEQLEEEQPGYFC
jgi:hypothetical protein